MRYFTFFAIGVVAVALLAAGPSAPAQVSFGINIGAPPVCPYGYFSYPPYDCAPYGYYGPDWFPDGVFIGAGPWFHGPHNFWGHVDNRYDPHHGYHGPLPQRGQRAFEGFQGNEARDGRGHVGNADHSAANEHQPGVQGGYHNGGGNEHGGGAHGRGH